MTLLHDSTAYTAPLHDSNTSLHCTALHLIHHGTTASLHHCTTTSPLYLHHCIHCSTADSTTSLHRTALHLITTPLHCVTPLHHCTTTASCTAPPRYATALHHCITPLHTLLQYAASLHATTSLHYCTSSRQHFITTSLLCTTAYTAMLHINYNTQMRLTTHSLTR